MAWIRRTRGWEIPGREAIPEKVYVSRRRFLQSLGVAGVGMYTGCSGGGESVSGPETQGPPRDPYPADRNPGYAVSRPITEEHLAARFNNFYEFTMSKSDVHLLAEPFQTRPWAVRVGGLVEHPKTYSLDDLLRRMPLEERVYRFRCVETWAMTVPWTGFPFRALIDEVKPRSSARYVRLVTFLRPEEAPGQKQAQFPWPYFEGLTMDEAMNDLTLLATGIYGHALPNQHGAPIRLVVPWKYGYKSIKSIVEIEFTAQEPPTFWNRLAANEYDFLANVDPSVPHPRWSQAYEGLLGSGDRVPTQLYNGYGQYVSHMYRA